MWRLDLDNIREEIDKLDKQLAKILEARLTLVSKVAVYKKERGISVKDAKREEMVINRVISQLENEEFIPAVKNIMHNIIDVACEMEEGVLKKQNQYTLKIACFGPPGSFTHQALEDYFAGQDYKRYYYNLSEEVIAAVSSGELDYGVLPIENSSTGGITEVYDLLRHYECSIVGERCIKIEQNLLACPGATLNTVIKVYSHPQGFAQSKGFFRDHPHMEQIPYFSTSKSAETVAEKKDITLAAVGGKKAAELYGLKVLAENINYNCNNFTRFVIIGKEQEIIIGADKITLVLAVKHEAGSLYKVLGYFNHGGLNLMNLESRPMDGKSWEYFFHIDLMGNLADPAVRDALEDIQLNCTFFKILGNYRADCQKE